MPLIALTLVSFVCIFFFGAQTGYASFYGHISIALAAIYGIRNISKYWIFWLLIALTYLTASEPRFSVEYMITALGLIGLGTSNHWTQASFETRRNILLGFFAIFLLSNYIDVGYNELGSLILWLPVFLTLYFSKLNKKNFLVYIISATAIFFAKKKAALIALFLSLRSKALYVLGTLVLIVSFFTVEKFSHFWNTSILPRTHLWQSVFKATLEKPFWGHGFGTFALTFHPHREAANLIGGKSNEVVNHGHSTFAHLSFELGLLGILALTLILYLTYINSRGSLLSLSFILASVSSLVIFSQHLLATMLLSPFIKDFGKAKNIFASAPQRARLVLSVLAAGLALFILAPSCIGHYYYSKDDYNTAIKWDKDNALYYFMRGCIKLKTDLKSSEKDIKKAIELSPSAPYFHGYLASSQLALKKTKEAKKNIAIAIERDGEIGYWYLIKAYTNLNNKEVFIRDIEKALKLNPKVKHFLSGKENAPSIIGTTGKYNDFRINTFFRQGPQLTFPIPTPIKP